MDLSTPRPFVQRLLNVAANAIEEAWFNDGSSVQAGKFWVRRDKDIHSDQDMIVIAGASIGNRMLTRQQAEAELFELLSK